MSSLGSERNMDQHPGATDFDQIVQTSNALLGKGWWTLGREATSEALGGPLISLSTAEVLQLDRLTVSLFLTS